MANRAAAFRERLKRFNTPSMRSWDRPPAWRTAGMKRNVALDCGWGRLIFGQTFADHESIIRLFQSEPEGRRDLAIYVPDHHVLVARAPDLLFVDPSYTYRLWLHADRIEPVRLSSRFLIRFLRDERDAEQVNRLYARCGMIPSPVETILRNQHTRVFSYFVAEDRLDNTVVGTIMGVDHREAFGDPDNGASFWCLAVDPLRQAKGLGRALISRLLDSYRARGRHYVDLSVLYDNRKAIRLYRSMGFRRVPVYVVKRKNALNRSFYKGGPKR